MQAIEVDNAEELLEILKQDVGENEAFEICKRDANGKFITFTKYVLNQNNNSNNDNIKEMFNNALNKTNQLNENTTDIMHLCNSIKGFQTIGIICDALNLCATAAGFYIMNDKIEKLSSNVDNIITNLKEANNIQTNYKYREIQTKYSNMLDYKRRNIAFSEKHI